MEETEWYYVRNGEQIGPLTLNELKVEWGKKTINLETYVWCDLMDNWEQISNTPELKSLLAASSTRRPPPLPVIPSSKPSTTRNDSKTSSSESVRVQSPKASQSGKANGIHTTGHASFLDELKDRNVMKKLHHVQLEEVKSSEPAQESTSSVVKPSEYRSRGQLGGKPSSSGASKWSTKSSSSSPSALEEKIVASSSTKSTSTSSNQAATKLSIKTSSKIRRGLQGNGWEERFTVDGVPYYYNPSTDCLSWEKPECLRTEEEKREGSSRWVWLEDPEQAWIPVCVESEKSGKIVGHTQEGRSMKGVSAGDVHWASLRELPDDVVLLEDSNEASILYTVRKRYLENKIYTWVGSNHTILLSINPFQPLPLYTPEQIDIHAHPPPNKPLPPHVYDLAYSAYRELVAEGTDQSILISGESGAGKTEATKQCLGFIAEIAGSDSSLEQKILQTNPVLEAFGNAKTVRNDNSSRFGKWIEIHFDEDNHICGASIECYLLEKSRVVTQQSNERNFHIFYQLFTSPEICRQYQLTSPEDYRYLIGGDCLQVQGIDDERDFNEVLRSLEALNFSDAERDNILNLVAAVLKIGNLQFVELDPNSMHPESQVANRDILEQVAAHLSVPVQAFEEAVCTRKLVVMEGNAENVTVIPLSVVEATRNCDALAKEIYSRIFDFIVVKINQTLNGERNRFIGFLDIFGFEIFQHNSFEQLCINYANERLQQLFNQSTFKEEETVYQNEGIPFTHVEFIDNTEVLEMIESTYGGLFCAINDQVRMRNGNDVNLMKTICNSLRKYSCFDGNCPDVNDFAITHYAGKVTYNINSFTDKNRDRIFDTLYDLVMSSSNTFISSLFPRMTTKQMKETVCSKFQKQLNDLVMILQRSQRKYIRCIKPNDKKQKSLFNCTHSLEQLRYSGIFEAVQIRKSGYPFRFQHKQFIHRYICLPMIKQPDLQTHRMTIKDQISAITKTRPECAESIVIGRSLVLYRADEHRILELARNLALDQLLPRVQSIVKSRICSVGIPLYINVTNALQNAIASRDKKTIETAMASYEKQANYAKQLTGRPVQALRQASEALVFLQKIVELEKEVKELVEGDLENNLEKAMRLVEQILSKPDLISQSTKRLAEEARARVETYASTLIEPPIAEALSTLDREELKHCVDHAIRLNYRSQTVQEAERIIALSEEDFFKLEIERAEQLGDISRLIDRKIKLRDLILKRDQPQYAFPSFSGLKTPEEYASHKIFTVNRKWWRDTMYDYTTVLIPTCLMNVSKELEKPAVLLYKNILGYMKDRKYSTEPEVIAIDIIRAVTTHLNPSLRTEAYCQLIKQLRNNPSPQSSNLGWRLMAIFLNWFLPEENFVGYLVVFLWENAPDSGRYIRLFNNSYYSSKYGNNSSFYRGQRAIPNQPEEITSFLNEFLLNNRKYSIEETMNATATATTPAMMNTVTRTGTLGAARMTSSPMNSGTLHSGTVHDRLVPSAAAGYNTIQREHDGLYPSTMTYSTLRTATAGSSTGTLPTQPASTSIAAAPAPATTINSQGTLHRTSPRGSSLVFTGGVIGAARAYTPHPNQGTSRPSTAGQFIGAPRSSHSSGLNGLASSTSTSSSSSATVIPSHSNSGSGSGSGSGSPRISYTVGTMRNAGNTAGTVRSPRETPSLPARAPPPPVTPPKQRALVLYDITKEINESVLECREGEEVVIKEDCGEWLLASRNGREGYVPYNYVEKL